jgi:hypothetical protein
MIGILLQATTLPRTAPEERWRAGLDAGKMRRAAGPVIRTGSPAMPMNGGSLG